MADAGNSVSTEISNSSADFVADFCESHELSFGMRD
jgi:hypothetical protein